MTVDELTGRLAVILHADVVGSTQLVQRDEQLAHARVRDAFQRFGQTITRYHGHLRELRGDALLAEFERASDAVSASLAFQREQGQYVDSLDDDIRPLLRIGAALGEVIVADNTVTGEGVVLAQRLEQLAEPGGLCITPAIREALPKRLPFVLDDLGVRELKGFADAIDVYRVRLAAGAELPAPGASAARSPAASARKPLVLLALLLAVAALGAAAYLAWQDRQQAASKPAAAQPASDRPSIAVLPFDNLSGDPEQEYFADGITEDLTTDLSRISGLFVVARNSSFAYKGRAVNVRTVAEELGVRYVIEGSVRRVGEQLRINAQLIDGQSGGHLWAERFDGTMAEVFQLQDRVNLRIVSALEVKLTADDARRIERVETVSPQAYDWLLRGVEQYNAFTRESVREARVFYRRAIEIDPNYARAYANIALTYSTEVNFYWTENRDESVRLGLEYANKALQLDDSMPQIYQTRSVLYLSQRQHQAALEAARRTIEVHPNYSDGFATLAFISLYAGKFDAALAAIDQAMRINPRGTGVFLAITGRALYHLRRYEEALAALRQGIERNPAFDRMHLTLAANYARMGRMDDAAWSVDEALAINPNISLATEYRDSIYLREEDLEDFVEGLRLAGVPE